MAEGSPPQVQKPKRGCVFYGCLTALGLFLATTLILYFSVSYAVNQFIQQFTQTKPADMPVVTISDEEFSRLRERLKIFQTGLDAGTPVEPLVLTANEINALINQSPALAPLKGKVFVTLEGNEVRGQVSMPLSGYGVKKLEGRYLNGSAVLALALTNATLNVTMKSVKINGVTPPERFMANIRSQNLAAEVSKDPKNAAEIRKLDQVEVRDGKLFLRVRP